MAILSGHKRKKRTITDVDGNHIPVSEWTHADSVEFDDNETLETKISDINERIDVNLSDINDQTPTYTVASSNTALTNGEKISVAFGKIAKAINSLISHLADTVSHITSAERTSWNAKLNSSAVTTSLASTSTTTALAASAGKNLQDQVTALNSDFTSVKKTHGEIIHTASAENSGYTGYTAVSIYFSCEPITASFWFSTKYSSGVIVLSVGNYTSQTIVTDLAQFINNSKDNTNYITQIRCEYNASTKTGRIKFVTNNDFPNIEIFSTNPNLHFTNYSFQVN